MEAFKLAVQRLSAAHLKRIAKDHNKSFENRNTKEDFADLLVSTLTPAQKSELLSMVLLAGRTSMSLFNLPGLEDDIAQPDGKFKRATETPQIVHMGDDGDVIEGQRLILWAMLDGNVTYLDPKLDLQTEPEAVVYPSMYDTDARIFQVRANSMSARKIARQFAKMNGVSPDGGGLVLKGIKTREEMNEVLPASQWV